MKTLVKESINRHSTVVYTSTYFLKKWIYIKITYFQINARMFALCVIIFFVVRVCKSKPRRIWYGNELEYIDFFVNALLSLFPRIAFLFLCLVCVFQCPFFGICLFFNFSKNSAYSSLSSTLSLSPATFNKGDLLDFWQVDSFLPSFSIKHPEKKHPP